MRCAILDDYQRVSREMADWADIEGKVQLTTFDRPLDDSDAVGRALREFDIVVLMRERTPFPRALFAALPRLKLLVTTGRRNAAIDLAAAAEHGVTVCGTGSLPHPTAELTWGLILALARHIPQEHADMVRGGPWQTSIGTDLKAKTLGVLGLGTLGAQVARIGRAFGMSVVAWSQNLTAGRCAEVGVELVAKPELFARADVLSIHLQLSPRTAGLVGAGELGQMKRTALLINTSRGPIVDQTALLDALAQGRIAGAGLDVYDTEPLPLDHPLRRVKNVVLTPHLGYVTENSYRLYFREVVEDIRAWLDGRPIRLLQVG